jgi:formate hydrogenlyase transcriptional activator
LILGENYRLVTDISVVGTGISVTCFCQMVRESVRGSAMTLLGELLAATADTHSPRAMVRAIATALSAQLPIVRVELRPPAPVAIAELAGGEWRCVETGAFSLPAQLIAPGLAVTASAALPEFCAQADFRASLGQVIAAATRHLEVIQRVARVSRRAHAENRELRADLERLGPTGEIVARSSAMRGALTRVSLVARHPTTVLLIGESGSGKEVLAREIHRRSQRAHRPIVQLNCGAIPEALVESELFGHERGAFTGAERTHAGVFERAHRGTLFLDEIGELPRAAQVKLLRVLQERQVRRVGGEAQLDVDVRLIAATNRPLASMVEQGSFREDLYYRLAVFTIEVPPLRERRGDLGPLVAALVGELAQRLGTSAPPISRSLLARLDAHDWPGNVRELMNVLETALILGGGDALELPEEFPKRAKLRAAASAEETGFEAAVRNAIADALRATRGKIYGVGGAASRLGLKPGTLQSKMRKLGIQRTDFA